MRRFFRELFKPALKCKRVGHKITVEYLKIRKEGSFGCAVEDFNAKRKICGRCGKVIKKPYNLTVLDFYTSCSMPDYMWDEMRENGYLILKYY